MVSNQSASARDHAERRRYYRIEDRVTLTYRIVSAQDYQALMEPGHEPRAEEYSIAGTFAQLNRQTESLLRRIKETDPDIGRYLASLNDKLDLLARSLAMEASELADESPQLVDLSAVGIAFSHQTELPPTTLLELKLLLFPSLVTVHALARVVRCAPGKNGFRIAVEFDYLADSDRELLIQHILHKESDLLRTRRAARDELEAPERPGADAAS